MAKTTRDKVAFVGCGYTNATRKLERLETELAIEACRMACEDAGVDPADVDGINPQVHHYPAPDTADIVTGLGMKDVHWQREGGMGIEPCGIAAQAIEAGECDRVLIVKIMNTIAPVTTPQIDPDSGGVAGPTQFEVPYGLGYSMQRVGLNARAYMHRYGYTEEDLGWLPVVEREHALLNPWAVMKTPMTIDDYMAARYIAEPVRLFDCDMPVNGAFAILMTRDSIAKGLKHQPVYLKAWAASEVRTMDHMVPEPLEGITPLAEELYRDAGLGPKDMDVWFPYDGFSFFASMWMENLGLVGRGEAGDYIKGGDNIRIGAEHPVNSHGGQLSEGRLHGMGHLLEATQQLRGTAGPRQAKNHNTAIISSVFPYTGAAGILSLE
jgi:acetyl-CoA acetyltransferase